MLVFRDRATLTKFVQSGWEFEGGGSATAMAGQGASAKGTELSSAPIKVYSMTRTGLAAGIAAGGRKYWLDKELSK